MHEKQLDYVQEIAHAQTCDVKATCITQKRMCAM